MVLIPIPKFVFQGVVAARKERAVPLFVARDSDMVQGWLPRGPAAIGPNWSETAADSAVTIKTPCLSGASA
jgi:hypothetical protein